MSNPTRRILIVEDHTPTRTVMARMVQAQGFKVATAGSLAEARREAEAGDIGFLISDLGLPDGRGWELMTELHARWGINGVAISGFGMERDVEHSRAAGFLLHITKPIDSTDLLRVLALAREIINQPSPPA